MNVNLEENVKLITDPVVNPYVNGAIFSYDDDRVVDRSSSRNSFGSFTDNDKKTLDTAKKELEQWFIQETEVCFKCIHFYRTTESYLMSHHCASSYLKVLVCIKSLKSVNM